MSIRIFSPFFEDIILTEQISIGSENHQQFYDQCGGIKRLLNGNYPGLDKNRIELSLIGKKRSVIILGGNRKTTITEHLPPIKIDICESDQSDVFLFSYAEDIDWERPFFSTKQTSTAVVDFSGRYSEYSELVKVIECCQKSFSEILLLFTEHDFPQLTAYPEISSKFNVDIVYHQPDQIRHYAKNTSESIKNKFFKKHNKDFVGYGDYLALMICHQLDFKKPLNKPFFVLCQNLIRRHIDDHEA